MVPEQEIIDEVYSWYKAWSWEDQEYFRTHNTVEFHHGIGRNIRNHFGLWQRPAHTPEIDDRGVDMSPNHPDAISSRILKAVQERAINDNTSNN